MPAAGVGNDPVGAGLRRDTERAAGVVLAGVHGWGNDVLEAVACKLVLPVALRPLISYSIDWLRAGVGGQPQICANSETGVLRRCLGDAVFSSSQVGYYEDRMPRGPAGCVRDAVAGCDAEMIVAVEGTILPRFDLHAMLDSHLESGAALTVVVEERTAQRRSGYLEPIGVYVFSRGVLEEIPATGYQDIKEGLIPKLYAAGRRVESHVVATGSAPRVTGSSTYLGANMDAVSWQSSRAVGAKGFVRKDRAWVHESAAIEPTARIKGPVLIGPNSRVSAGALVIGPAVLGRGCVLERDSVVTRSVLWDRCRVGSGAILDNTVMTSETSVDPLAVARHAVFARRRSPRRR